MGFDGITGFVLSQTQVEVAVAAADGDLNVAVEILMSQQVISLTGIDGSNLSHH